jgi:uncharacterized membrane protein
MFIVIFIILEQVSACLFIVFMFWILGSSRDGSEKPFYEIVFFMI